MPAVGRRARPGPPRSGPATVTIATLAWFLAAARTIDGPPMSISSMSSSTRDARRARAAAANGYRLTTTSSNGAMPAAEELLAVVVQPPIGEQAGVDRAGAAS